MSQPAGFSSVEEYLAASVRALRRHRRLFQRPNTHVLLSGALRLPLAGLRRADVFAPAFRADDCASRLLRAVCADAAALAPHHAPFRPDAALEAELGGGAPAPPAVGPKKRHEVAYLAQQIHDMCSRAACRTVVDFGSGLGYLDERLFAVGEYRVLALEAERRHHEGARRRQRRLHAASAAAVRHVRHTVTEEASRDVPRLLEQEFPPGERFLVGGLHACADLAVHALRVFVEARAAALLAVVPCCYHKMAPAEHDPADGDGTVRFVNFPLSAALRREVELSGAREFLTVAALRLAAQPRRPREPPPAPSPAPSPPLRRRAFHLLARAALQLYAHRHKCHIKRNKRKPVRAGGGGGGGSGGGGGGAADEDFDKYLAAAVQGYSLTKIEPCGADDKVHFDLDELRAIWGRITDSSTFKRAGMLIIIQNYLQDIIENLILFDRLLYLRENGIEKCYYKKVLDDEISPRALALIAYK